ncbi:MAG: glycosyltransferase family 4 protein [Lentimicrobium sp.]|nr:glycosyltransferase family 4 protein [Lentimicrobium sp.]
MKKILIISPNFPPVNAADMHRVRQSIGFFRQMGWESTVVAVEPAFIEMSTDPILLETLPADADIIRIPAWKTATTRKFGLGNIGYRSLSAYYKTGNRLLKTGKFDLVYFSTTAFPVMVLGRIWKRKFGVPYIIDMQDPWRNDFYLDKPKNERPPKFWMAYRMDKYMEAYAMKKVDGIISVSEGYPKTLMERYNNIKPEMCSVIPFGGAGIDFEILEKTSLKNNLFKKEDGKINLVYIGRGGHDMNLAVNSIFHALKSGLDKQPELFGKIRLFFVGTSYAADGKGIKTIEPLAEKSGVGQLVSEITDRLPYFEAMKVLKDADLLIIPGSTDTNYTASKLYPYILANKPLLAVFNENSSVVDILDKTRAGVCVIFHNDESPEVCGERVLNALNDLLIRLPFIPDTNWNEFEPYSAREASRRQVDFFNKVTAE